MANINLGNTLSDAVVAAIRDTVNKHMREYINTKAHLTPPGHLLDIDDATGIAPEIYIARTPSTGIPGRSSEGVDGVGAILNGENCDIFLLDPPSEETDGTVGVVQHVFNLSDSDIPGDSWVVVVRDKYGTWFAIPTATGSGCTDPGYGWVAGLTPSNCLHLTVESASGRCSNIDTNQELDLVWNGTAWESTEPFDWGQPSGSDLNNVLFYLQDGVPTMTIGGYYLTIDGSCRQAGDRYIEFAGGNELCDPDVEGTSLEERCADNTFVVRLECAACPELEYICCEGTPLPYVLFITFTGTGAPEDPIPLYYDTFSGYWIGCLPITIPLCDPLINTITLQCSPGAEDLWGVTIDDGNEGTGTFCPGDPCPQACPVTFGVLVACDPFELTGTLTDPDPPGDCPTWSFVVTE